ncbi:MAG: glycosyltransferase family 4 protein [Chloroflexi bacterium]|nr:glycosyltransferase family 4 protein [Chloroflexota bacterium]
MRVKSISWLHQINYGGVETRAHRIADCLSRSADVELLFAGTLGKVRHYQNQNGLKYTPLQIYFNPYKVYHKRFWEEFFINKATRYLKKRRGQLDVVDGQGINAIPGINLGVPAVTTIHGVDRWIKNPPALERLLLEKASKIIAISEKTGNRLSEAGVNRDRIKVIHNGVDFDRISNTTVESPGFLKKYGVDPDKKIILSVHNFLRRIKNTEAVIDCFVSFKRRHPEYQLVLIGGGPDKPYYLEYARRTGGEDIHFTGTLFNEELYRFYKSAHIFLLPSFSEHWPITPFEAMAARCPVILTRNCDVTEMVKDKKHLVLVDPHDTSDIEKAVRMLVENNDLREELKENGYELARNLRWEKQAELFNYELEYLR